MERKEEKLEERLEKGEEEKAEEIGKAKSFLKGITIVLTFRVVRIKKYIYYANLAF